MKNLIAVFFLLCSTMALSQDYPVFPNSMAIWTNTDIGYEIGAGITSISTTKFNLDNQDTLINGIQYSQVFYEDSFYIGGIRTQEDQVFFALHSDTLEYLLYDFGAQLGDTIQNVFFTEDGNTLHNNSYFQLTDYIVYYVDSIMCEDNVLRKRLHVSSDASLQWVEGIGSAGGLFWWSGANVSDYYVDLARLCVNDEIVFSNEEVSYLLQDTTEICSSDYVVGLNELKLQTLSIYPNPVNEVLFLEANDLNSNSEILLLNSLGQNVQSFSLSPDEKYQLDVSELTSGIYVLLIRQSDHWYSEKVMID